VPWLIVLGAVQGVINAFDTPARQAFLIEIISSRDDLANGIALNSSMVHLARMIGPPIAGVLIAGLGEGWCFAADAVSYLAVIASLVAISVPARKPHPRTGHLLGELGDGLRAITSVPMIKGALVMLSLSCLLGGPYSVLMPMLAVDRFGGDAYTLGFLTGAAGLGALTGALYLAQRASVVGLGGVIGKAAIGFGVALVALAWSPSEWLALPMVYLAGACFMLQLAATNTIVQSLIDEDKRGRVLGFYTLFVFGFTPIGGLIEGALANRLGVALTITIGGAAVLACALVFQRALPGLRRASRPRYEAQGLLPPA
jgi:MFS family permease